MQKLYEKCFDENLINSATKYILTNYTQYMLTEKDIKHLDKETIKKEVKLRLRRYKKVHGKLIINRDLVLCELNEYYMYNIYDLITQQVIYQVLKQNVIEDNEYTFGYKKEGLIEKNIVIKTANILQTSKSCFIIKFDFTEIFNKINLNDIIMEFKNIGIKDIGFLKTLKHILWHSKTYNGIGINKYNILYPLIITIYLNSFDKYIEYSISRNNNSYQRNFNKHKEHYIEWLQETQNKPYVQFYRHNECGILICHSKVEQLYMQNKLLNFSVKFKDLKIDTFYNRILINGFYIKKRKLERNYLEIKIANIQLIKQFIRTFKFNSFLEVWTIKKWILMIMSYYDIVNDISELTNALINRMYYRSNKHNSHLKKIKNKSEYVFNSKNITIVFDIFDIRNYTKISYKEYMFNKFWIKSKDYLTPWNTVKFINCGIYKQALFVKQQGKDILTKKPLDFNDIHVHYLVAKKDNGLDALKNLILISSETYKEIYKYYRLRLN